MRETNTMAYREAAAVMRCNICACLPIVIFHCLKSIKRLKVNKVKMNRSYIKTA